MGRRRLVHSCDLPRPAIRQAVKLVAAVHDEHPGRVALHLTRLTREQLYATVVTLAALVPDDRSPSELLAWNDDAYRDRRDNKQVPLAPHGSHAAFNRHRKRGEQPCLLCADGERMFQRERHEKSRVEVAS